jgi:hypothetical protein
VVPGDCELDLEALARATGDKKIDTVPLKEVEPLTGYLRGRVAALACKTPVPVYLDETARLFDLISISAGPWGGRKSISCLGDWPGPADSRGGRGGLGQLPKVFGRLVEGAGATPPGRWRGMLLRA